MPSPMAHLECAPAVNDGLRVAVGPLAVRAQVAADLPDGTDVGLCPETNLLYDFGPVILPLQVAKWLPLCASSPVQQRARSHEIFLVYYPIIVWQWASYLTALSFASLIWKMGPQGVGMRIK